MQASSSGNAVNAATVQRITLATQAGAAAEEGTTAGLAIAAAAEQTLESHPLIEPRSRGGWMCRVFYRLPL